MKWTKEGNYAIRCGDYVITKNSTSHGWIYLAFYRKELIARTKSGEDAERACDEHTATVRPL